jgi:hypothetical protein
MMELITDPNAKEAVESKQYEPIKQDAIDIAEAVMAAYDVLKRLSRLSFHSP